MGEKLRRKDRQLNEEAGKMQVWHSIFYHQHFDGYEESYDADGSGKIRRVYTAEYYRQALPRTKSIRNRVGYSVLFAVGMTAYICGASMPVACNCVWYVNLPQALSLPCLLYTFFALCHYVVMPEKMERRYYRTAVRGFAAGIRGVEICSAFSALSVTVFLLREGISGNDRTVLSLALFVITGAAALVIGLNEHRVFYEKLEN